MPAIWKFWVSAFGVYGVVAYLGGLRPGGETAWPAASCRGTLWPNPDVLLYLISQASISSYKQRPEFRHASNMLPLATQAGHTDFKCSDWTGGPVELRTTLPCEGCRALEAPGRTHSIRTSQ